MADTITRYFHDIRNSKPLSREEEVELARLAQAGNEAAISKLINANLRFVVTIARQYQGRGMELEDLISEGNIGLIESVKRFDPEAGYRLISYSVFWIRQAIQAAISNNKLIRLPMNKINLTNSINKVTSRYIDREGRKPTDAELSKECGISIQDVRLICRANQYAVDLDQKVGDDDEDGSSLEEILDSGCDWADAESTKEGLKTDLLVLLKTFLSERECTIIIKSYGIDTEEICDEAIAKELGVSAERVRQIKLAALHKLRKNVKVCEALRQYLA